MRPLLLFCLLGLSACAPSLLPFDPSRLPDPADWDPRPAPLEWWYASGHLGRYAFHFAFFKAYPPRDYQVMGLPTWLFFPGPFHAVHLSLTDLRTGERTFLEASDFPKSEAQVGPGPTLALAGFRFFRQGASFRLEGGPLALELHPLKPPVLHPPGYSGTEETGRMYYQSYTRLMAQGQVLGEEVEGLAWLDHQWGDQPSGFQTTWDWFGLHLFPSGSSHLAPGEDLDLMVYQVKDKEGRVVQTLGSLVDQAAKPFPIRLEPRGDWTFPSGRRYTLFWLLEGPGLRLEVRPLLLEGEILSRTTQVAYWEGPVLGEGSLEGRSIRAQGMGEFVAGPWRP